MAKWVKAYAADEQLFFRDYAAAHTKLSELGQVRKEGRKGGGGRLDTFWLCFSGPMWRARW